MFKLKNHDELVNKLHAKLIESAIDCDPKTGIYLVYDEENQTAEIDTIIETGANYCLDDNYFFVGSDGEDYRYEWLYYWEQIYEFAEALDISEEQLIQEAIEYDDEYEDYDDFMFDSYPNRWHHVRNYIIDNGNYMEKLKEVYATDIKENFDSNYRKQAEELISDGEMMIFKAMKNEEN